MNSQGQPQPVEVLKVVEFVIAEGADYSSHTETLEAPDIKSNELTIALVPIEILVPDVPEMDTPILAGPGGGGSPITDPVAPPANPTNPQGSTPETINFALKAATELKVAKMEHSLDANHKIDASKDHDCFYLRIPSFKIAGVTHQKGHIKIKISTKDASDHTEHNDPAGANEWIDLEPVLGSDTWMTKSLLLVSDKGVDDLPAGQGADYAADEQANDRTHVVELGGKVVIEKIKILTDEHTLNIEIPVKTKKEVPIKAVYLQDQPINESLAKEYLKIANERMAQIGVKLKIINIKPMPVSTQHMQSSDIMAVFKPQGSSRTTPHPEAKALVDTYKSTIDSTITENDIVVFFCQQIRYPSTQIPAGQCVRGLATFPSYANSTGAFENSGFQPETPAYANKIFISAAHRGPFTVAHEIMHCLSDQGHFGVDYNPDNLSDTHHKVLHNLMRYGTSAGEAIDSTKRLYDIQELLVYPTN